MSNTKPPSMIRLWTTDTFPVDVLPESPAFEGENPLDHEQHTMHFVTEMRGKTVYVLPVIPKHEQKPGLVTPWVRGRVETWEEEAVRLRELLDAHHTKTLGLHSAAASATLDRVNELSALRGDIQRTANALFGIADTIQMSCSSSDLTPHIQKLNDVSKGIGAVSDWLLTFVPRTEGT